MHAAAGEARTWRRELQGNILQDFLLLILPVMAYAKQGTLALAYMQYKKSANTKSGSIRQ